MIGLLRATGLFSAAGFSCALAFPLAAGLLPAVRVFSAFGVHGIGDGIQQLGIVVTLFRMFGFLGLGCLSQRICGPGLRALTSLSRATCVMRMVCVMPITCMLGLAGTSRSLTAVMTSEDRISKVMTMRWPDVAIDQHTVAWMPSGYESSAATWNRML
jgi:hypothetical protein